jgi:hypothetical protein
MGKLVRVASAEDIPPGSARLVEVEGKRIAVFIESRINNGKIVRSMHHPMGHETFWDPRATGKAPSVCGAAPEGWTDTVSGRPPAPRLGEFGVSVVAGVSTSRAAGAARQADPGTAAGIVHRAESQAGPPAGKGPAPGRLHHRSLDPGAGDHIDLSGVRHSVSPRSRLEAPDRTGLELSEAGATCRGAG